MKFYFLTENHRATEIDWNMNELV